MTDTTATNNSELDDGHGVRVLGGVNHERVVVVRRRRRFSVAERRRVWCRTDGICYLCKSFMKFDCQPSWEVEHVFAFSSDPQSNDVLGNLLPSCRRCNRRKSNKSLLDVICKTGFSLATDIALHPGDVQPRVKNVLLAALK